MLLGIDASRAVTAAPTGTENYSRQLIRAMLELPSSLRFRLYTRSFPPSDLFPATGNYEIRTIPFPRLWTHARLSAEMLRHPPDALWVPAHVIPPLHPRRTLVTVHDLGYRYFPQAHPPLARLYLDLSTRWNAHAAAGILADSEATRRDLAHFYRVNPDKVRVVYPALNPEWQHLAVSPEDVARVGQHYHTGGDYMIAVGTVHPRKNYRRLLQAFAQLPQPYRLVIVGKKGWLYQEIFETLQQLDLGDRVLFLDYVPPADLPPLYAGARLAVMPSLYEGFGFPVLEAQACGTPVACSNTSSLPEAAGEGAEFFDPRAVEAMAAAMRRVLSDAARRDALIALGKRNVERFSWARAAEQVVEEVEKWNAFPRSIVY
ncbi:MAG: glycosyltransferase family 1 protein [Anaerolineae bacterium]